MEIATSTSSTSSSPMPAPSSSSRSLPSLNLPSRSMHHTRTHLSGKNFPPTTCMDDCVNMSSSSHTHNAEGDKGDTISASGLLDQGLLSCVSCGILSFSCVAVVKPRVRTAKYFMTSDYNLINDQLVGSRTNHLADALRSERTNGGILRFYVPSDWSFTVTEFSRRAQLCQRKTEHGAVYLGKASHIHYETTGPEIREDTLGQVDIFVMGIGSGGTVPGVGKYLKEKNPNAKIYGVEPAESNVLNGGKPGPHLITRNSVGIKPEILDMDVMEKFLEPQAREKADKEGFEISVVPLMLRHQVCCSCAPNCVRSSG